MEVNLSIQGIGRLFQDVFGYFPNAFEPELNTIHGINEGLRTDIGSHGSEYYGKANGREYYLPVKITYPSDPTIVDNVPVGLLKDWNLPYPLVSVFTRKTIIETPLTERRGTAKELINIQDYEIFIRGFIINEINEFPEEEVALLRNLYELNVPIGIANPITDIFLLRPDRKGSDQVVIKELRFPEVAGVKNIRPYELVLVSDQGFNLIEIVP